MPKKSRRTAINLAPPSEPEDQSFQTLSPFAPNLASYDPDLLLNSPSLVLADEDLSSIRSSSRQRLTLLTGKAVRTLEKGLDSVDMKVALTAANSILDRDGIVKPAMIFTEDSSFSPGIILSALLGAAKVFGANVSEDQIKRSVMEIESQGQKITMASEVGPAPKLEPEGLSGLQQQDSTILIPETSVPIPKPKSPSQTGLPPELLSSFQEVRKK